MTRDRFRGRLRTLGLLACAVLTLFSVVYSQEGFQVGFAFFTATDDHPAPVGTALFSFRNPQGLLVSEAAVGATPPITRGRVYVGGDAPTGIAFSNPWKEELSADLTVRNPSGVETANSQITLGPRTHSARFFSELFPALDPGFVGSLTFETTDPQRGLGAVTLRQSTNSHGEPLFATLPVVDLTELAAPAGGSGDIIVFPQIGAGPGLSTAVILINGSDAAVSGAILLTGSDGNPLNLTSDGVTGSQFPYQLPAHGTRELQFTSSSGELLRGYATVTLNEGPALPSGTAIFRFRAGDDPISEAGVAAVPPTDRARIFVDNVDTMTGVALAIPGAPATNVNFSLLSLQGEVLKNAQLGLPANGQTAVFVDQIFPDLEPGFTGLMEISTAAAGLQGNSVAFVPVSLKLTINPRGDTVLTTLPVADLNRLPGQDTFIFSQVGFGAQAGLGELGTRLIFISVDVEGNGEGRLFFFRSDGSDLPFPYDQFTDSRFTYETRTGGEIILTPGIEFDIAAILVDPSNLVVNEGNTTSLNPVALDEEGVARDDFVLEFASLDAATVSVDQAGNITGEKRGFANIVISSGEVVETFPVVVSTLTEGGAGFAITGIAQDFGGRVYLANHERHMVMLSENLTDVAQRFAGTDSVPGYEDEIRLDALFNAPTFLALNQAGATLYVADSSNHAIRAVSQGEDGTVSTLAGTTAPGDQDGDLSEARFDNPRGIALDRKGRLWVVDSNNHTVRRIDLVSDSVETIAGLAGSAGMVDGIGSQARFNGPTGIAAEKESVQSELERQFTGDPPPPISVVVSDTGNGVLRRIWEDGRVETIGTGNVLPANSGVFVSGATQNDPVQFQGPTGVVVDSFGNIYVSEPSTGRVRLLLVNGDLVQAAQTGSFNSPQGLAITRRGRVVVAERLSGVQEIRYAGPGLGSINPPTAGSLGGESISLNGTNFAPDSIVLIDGKPVLDTEVVSTSRIDFTLPPVASGIRTLTVQHRGGLAQFPFPIQPVPFSELNDGEVTTLVGGTEYGGDGQVATSAATAFPGDVAVSPAGDIYVADTEFHRIRKMDAVSLVLTTIAGTGVRGWKGDGGPAVSAALHFPSAIALDGGGHLFIADTGNHIVRRLDLASGIISRVAGNGEAGFSGDGGPALNARLSGPEGVAVVDGSLLIADTQNQRIRRVETGTGIITTLYPSPASPGPLRAPSGQAPSFFGPADLAVQGGVNLLIANPSGHTVEVLELPGGPIYRLAGTGDAGFSGDKEAPEAARLDTPSDVTVDSTGAVYIADAGNHRVRRVDPLLETIDTVAGTGVPGFSGDGGSALEANLDSPLGVATDAADDLLIADLWNHRIRRVARKEGTITTVAGNGDLPPTGDGGPAWAASLSAPHEIAVSPAGQIFVADSGHHRLRLVAAQPSAGPARPAGNFPAEGFISSIVGNGIRGLAGNLESSLDSLTNYPHGVALDVDGNLLFSENGNHRVRRINEAVSTFSPSLLGVPDTTGPGSIQSAAGTGMEGFSGEGGQAIQALLNSPRGVAALGNDFYFADELNHRIRRVDGDTGVIQTVAGNGIPGFSGNGGLAIHASLKRPTAVAVLPNGDFLIADTGNHQIRRVFATTGIIGSVAGTGNPGFSGDGGPATQAALNSPEGVALDVFGSILIADTGNHRVRRVTQGGVISTLSGTGLPGSTGDGGDALDATFRDVGSVFVDSANNVFITDRGNRRIRVVRNP